MTAELADMVQVARGQLATAFLVFLRIGAVVAVLPAFGEQTLPVRVRLAVVIVFTVVVMPAVGPILPGLPSDLFRAASYGASEVASGLILGLGVRMFVLALQTAGTIIGQATSLAQIAGGGVAPDTQPAVAHLLTTSGLALAVSAGLHVHVAGALISSYEVFLPGKWPDAPALADWGVARTAEAFALAFSLAAPFVGAVLIYNLALGVINRAMPQLMVSFVGAPALVFGVLALMLVSSPILLEIWSMALFDHLRLLEAGRP